MPVNHLLDATDTVPTMSPMKSKISPEEKIKSHKQGTDDPRKPTSSGEELESKYNLLCSH